MGPIPSSCAEFLWRSGLPLDWLTRGLGSTATEQRTNVQACLPVTVQIPGPIRPMKQHCNFSVEEDFELHNAGARAVNWGTWVWV
jgi:hypothetical protein